MRPGSATRSSFRRPGQVADDIVVKVLGAGAGQADGMGAPAPAKVVAAGGQFADKVVQSLVMRVASGFGAKDADAGVGGEVPVG